jgi:hypothetical protein
LPPDELELQQLTRQAVLAHQVLVSLRKPGRSGSYESERHLRGLLADDGVQFSWGDLAPALALAEAAGLLVRDGGGLGLPRGGRLPGVGTSPVVPPEVRVARVVVEVCRPGQPGRGTEASRDQIAERLAAADEDVPDLEDVLTKLVDCGQLIPRQRTPGAPMGYSVGGGWQYDATDELEAQIVRVLRERGEPYRSEAELAGWLVEAGVVFDGPQLVMAVSHLTRLNRLRSQRPDMFEGDGEPPTYLVEAVPHSG